MIVVDTNVLAHLMLGGELHEAAHELRQRDEAWHTEPLAFQELTNVLATAMRVRQLPLAEAQRAAAMARALPGLQVAAVSDADALTAAAHFGISGYDARFIVLARALGTPLVTEDRRLRAAVPAYTRSIAEAIAA